MLNRIISVKEKYLKRFNYESKLNCKCYIAMFENIWLCANKTIRLIAIFEKKMGANKS